MPGVSFKTTWSEAQKLLVDNPQFAEVTEPNTCFDFFNPYVSFLFLDSIHILTLNPFLFFSFFFVNCVAIYLYFGRWVFSFLLFPFRVHGFWVSVLHFIVSMLLNGYMGFWVSVLHLIVSLLLNGYMGFWFSCSSLLFLGVWVNGILFLLSQGFGFLFFTSQFQCF